MPKHTQATPCHVPSDLYPFYEYIRGRGLTRVTGYRYRQRGMIVTQSIYGRLYITAHEIRRFEARVIAGEFEQKRKPATGKKTNPTA